MNMISPTELLRQTKKNNNKIKKTAKNRCTEIGWTQLDPSRVRVATGKELFLFHRLLIFCPFRPTLILYCGSRTLALSSGPACGSRIEACGRAASASDSLPRHAPLCYTRAYHTLDWLTDCCGLLLARTPIIHGGIVLKTKGSSSM